MAETPTALRRILEKIRDDAEQALRVLGDSEEPRSIAWKCSGCGHVKHFTRPVPAGSCRAVSEVWEQIVSGRLIDGAMPLGASLVVLNGAQRIATTFREQITSRFKNAAALALENGTH